MKKPLTRLIAQDVVSFSMAFGVSALVAGPGVVSAEEGD